MALGAVDRAALLLDSYALAKANLAPIDTVVEVLRAMVNENSYIGWTAIAGILSALYLQMEQVGGAAFEAFKEFGKTIVLNALAQIGWDAQPSDGHTEKLLRNTVIGLLDSFAPHDPAVLAEARRCIYTYTHAHTRTHSSVELSHIHIRTRTKTLTHIHSHNRHRSFFSRFVFSCRTLVICC